MAHMLKVMGLALIILTTIGVANLGTELIPKEYTITDHVGRDLTVPVEINTVFVTNQTGTLLVYALSPDTVIGWNRGLEPDMAYLLADNHNLPTLGTWDLEYQTLQKEKIRQLNPDVIMQISPTDLPNIQLAEKLQEALGIPTLIIDSSLEAIPESLRFIGSLLGVEVRAQALALSAQTMLERVQIFLTSVNYNNRISAYIVHDSPESAGRSLEETFSFASLNLFSEPQFGDKQADLILYMPHPIKDIYREISRDPHLADHSAFIAGQVYPIPQLPLNWLGDSSLCRLMGIQWLAMLAYPNLYPASMGHIFAEFMEVFYDINIAPEVLVENLTRSGINH